MALRTARRRPGDRFGPGSLVEPLESRMLFGGSPFPNLTDLENQNDTVVRLNTNYGDIDIELLDTVTPITVTNFVHYVRDGDYDGTFFHRLVSGFILQGGQARFLDGNTGGVRNIPTDPTIMNEFQRSNVARTLAMAKIGPPQGQPPTPETINSATSQFFFNLADNSTNLDNQNGGFTVFARVINDASWAVVTTMAGLRTINGGGGFTTLPVNASYMDGQLITEADLATIRDAEIIKAAGTTIFYTQHFYYPEGFAGSTINEFLPIGNAGDTAVLYQVIVRSEVINGDITTTAGWYRDRVISTGTIAPHTRGGITISQFGPGGVPGTNDLVPQGVPYAIEVQATGQLAVNLSHYDFGTSTGESFVGNSGPATMWGFGDLRKENGSVFDFLVWQNAGSAPANLQITFYFQTAAPVTLNVTTVALRRGGFAFQNVTQIPDHTNFSARIVSDVPIVAALSHFDNRGDQQGSTALGVPGNGSEFGIVPMGSGGAGTNQILTFLNANLTALVVSVDLIYQSPFFEDQGRSTLVIPAQSRRSVDLTTLGNTRINSGERFSVRYRTAPQGAAVYAHAAHNGMTDAVSNPFAIEAATGILFAEGFMDPARAGINVFETLSFYNPNSVFFTGTNTNAAVTISFFYTDGFQFDHTANIAGGQRLDLDLHTLQAILDEGTMHSRFFYSIRVTSNVPIVGQMFHYDLTLGGAQASGGFSTNGTNFGTITRLDAL